MRYAFLVLMTALLAVAVSAQSNAAAPQAEQPGPQPSPLAAAPIPPSAPAGLQPGHPLDPADVAVLTGKSQTSIPAGARSTYAMAYGAVPYYYPYAGSVPMFGNSGFSTWDRTGQSFLFPTFGTFNPHFFFFGGFRHGGGRGFFGPHFAP